MFGVNHGLSFGTKLPWEEGNLTYSEINTLARELAFLVMWLNWPTSFRSKATSSAVSAWMGDPPTRYSSMAGLQDVLRNICFHRVSATGMASRQGTLTPPDTWSRHFGFAYVLRVATNPFSELVVIFPDYALRISLGTFSILPHSEGDATFK